MIEIFNRDEKVLSLCKEERLKIKRSKIKSLWPFPAHDPMVCLNNQRP